MFSTCVHDNNTRNTRNSTRELSQPYRKTNKGQKGLSYLGPSIWNSIDTRCKVMPSLNTFKHSTKTAMKIKLSNLSCVSYCIFCMFLFYIFLIFWQIILAYVVNDL